MSMPAITIEDKTYQSRKDETVLDTLLRNAHNISFSCRNGSCHTCLLKAQENHLPKVSQAGLSDALKSKNYLKACRCIPESDLSLSKPDIEDYLFDAEVIDCIENNEAITLVLMSDQAMDTHAGQTISIGKKAHHELILLPMLNILGDPFIKVHLPAYVEHPSADALRKVKVGTKVKIGNPIGKFHYHSEYSTKPILIIADQQGLYVVDAMINEAVNVWGYAQPITIITASDQSLPVNIQELIRTTQINLNINSLDNLTSDFHQMVSKYPNHLIYIATAPRLSNELNNLALSYSVNEVFQLRFTRQKEASNIHEHHQIPEPKPEPCPELWEALDNGRLLTEILTDFYEIIFADERLGAYFSHVTKQRLIEKQYNYLYEQITGKEVYLGADIRNAHHWMVISDELFDHRSSILKSVIDKYKLPTHLAAHWIALEEQQRERIVKNKPWDKMLDGCALNLDRFETTTLDFGGLCDSCGREINSGETIKYHLRLGKMFCDKCQD